MMDDTRVRPFKKDMVHICPLRGGHVTNGPDCWCIPRIEQGEYADLVIHNQFAAGVKRPSREC